MRKRLFGFLMVTLLVLSSCIRDEVPPCPPLQIKIAIRDKNYFNIDEAVRYRLDEERPTDLPFKDYIARVYYHLYELETGKTVKEQTTFTLTGGEEELALTFPQELPFGKYVLTVWGNLTTERPLDDFTMSEMHLENLQGNDIYTSQDTFVYTEQSFEFLAEMERVKGKLIVIAENLPDHINYSTKDIDHLYSLVSSNFWYGRPTTIHTDTLWQKKKNILTHTLACPSTGKDESTLDLNFYRMGPRVDGEVNWVAPEDVRITMSRNTLTIIRFVYEEGGEEVPWVPIDPVDPIDPPDPPDPPIDPPLPPEGNSKFKIHVLVNDHWEDIHGMVID